MIYRIHSSDANTLLDRPETGMGYQIVEASKILESDIKRYIVYNSQIAVDLDLNFKTYKRQLFSEGYTRALNTSNQLVLSTNSIRVLNKTEVLQTKALSFSEAKRGKKRHSGDKGSKDNPKEYANGSEVFVRLSAYEEDKRIDFEKKKLKPGSYTTTDKDYLECVATNDDPVDRYALPNDEEIKWAFYIKPKSSDTLQRGIVQPAFDHEGGGIEAYFENGTSDDTYLQKKRYGQ
jgi:hypothetical protein